MILCSSKNKKVVEYAMSRSMSPTMIADYILKLIDKKLLDNKLEEISDFMCDSKMINVWVLYYFDDIMKRDYVFKCSIIYKYNFG